MLDIYNFYFFSSSHAKKKTLEIYQYMYRSPIGKYNG